MKEILKRFTTLLCLVLMLGFVSMPAFGGENPWDSDGSSDSSNPDEGTGSEDPDPDGSGFLIYLGNVYIGGDGLLTFVSQSVNYLFTSYIYIGSRATDRPDSRTETSQQEDF
jgi:hypothetical protein